MIVILSYDNEITTDAVISWLISFNVPFIRLNRKNKITIKDLVISNSEIDFTLSLKNGRELKYSEITSFWYRRDNFNIEEYLTIKDLEYDNLKDQISGFLKDELLATKELLHYLLQLKGGVNNFFTNFTNKAINLLKAIEVGLIVPTTYITSNKQSLSNYKLSNNLVSKILSQGCNIRNLDETLESLTVEISDQDVNLVSDTFFPTLFQKMIIKKFELRVFYLAGDFYSSAIFSQNNEKTKLDFRNYDAENPNRIVPFNLPISIKDKLRKLMKILDMNCGSIDIIYTIDDKYVFLEANPIGQFQQVSIPCNYYLEREVAIYLKNKHYGI
jgi:ATP-GRASP peptide maturase of grasp-with-spasm system